MESIWEFPWQPFDDNGKQNSPPFFTEGLPDAGKMTERLDTILPADPLTGAATSEALETYLSAMMLMTSRNAQPLTLLHIAVDDNERGNFLGVESVSLIGRAMARCMRQETRSHDVVGRAPENSAQGVPAFLLVCPLMTEEKASQLAERLRAAMTADGTAHSRSWLTVSVGIAGMAMDVSESASLIGRTMAATRRARQQGGNRIWRHSDTLRALVERSDRDDDNRSGAL